MPPRPSTPARRARSGRHGRRVGALVVAAVATASVVGGAAVLLGRAHTDEPSRAAATSPTPTTSPSPSPSATPTPSAAPAPAVELPTARPPKVRISAGDPYALSVAVSKAAFPGSARARVVYLVSGESQLEAYGTVPAAAVQGGAVLLTRPDGIPRVTAKEIDRLRPERIVLVGDTEVLAQAVARAAADHAPTVERVDGAGRVGTSLELARHAFTTAKKAWVVDGSRPEHAVVAATAAAANRAPVLLVDGSARALPAAHAELLRRLGVTDVTVVGPASAVSEGVAGDLEDVVGAGRVVRATGADRYAVAARVNALAFPSLPEGVAYLANGASLTNAFAGAFLAGNSQRPLYYSLSYCVPASARPSLTEEAVSRVVLLGGEGSVRLLAGRLEPCRSITDPESDWVLVNRRNPLSPRKFAPSDLVVPNMQNAGGHQLRADAAAALAEMASAVAGASGRIGIDTAYRSYSVQDELYADRLASRGRTWTDTWYARPGFSEHQTGLTVDLLPIGEPNCSINDCIDETPQGRWLMRNSWRHGYIVRYEKGYRATVGLGFEPWHFRYVGTALAKAYHDGGWHTYEGFLGQPAAPTY